MELKQVIDELNSQEQEAYDHGYIKEDFVNYLPNYLPAKMRLLKAIKDTEEEIKDAKDDDKIKQLNNKKQLLNAARIYTYTLFENTWFGYLIAYANKSEITFELDGKKINPKSYNNHLPSFSSAILHFGTCRDLFFPLLKTLVYLHHNDKIESLIENFNKRNFFRCLNDTELNDTEKLKKDEKYNRAIDNFLASNIAGNYGINNRTSLKNDLEGYFSTDQFRGILERYSIDDKDKQKFLTEIKKIKKNFPYQKNKDKKSDVFNDDLEILLNNSNVQQEARGKYLNQAKCFFELNKFRNTFAHQLRMLWWKNKELWGFSNEDYENMRLGRREFHDVLIDIFKDHRTYEGKIEGLAPSQFKHSAKILEETHDTIATFINETFALILPQPTD